MGRDKGRIESFDFFRAYGCLAIVLLHVVSAWRDDPTNSAAFYNAGTVRMLFDNAIVPLLVRMAVPIFFMMSGVLFLNPERDVSWDKIKKHVVKLLFVLGIFGYPMAVIELVADSRSFQISYLWTALLNLLQQETWSHLWYLYATIGLYLITPILRSWIEKATEKEKNLIMGLTILLLSGIPTINSLTGLTITSFGLTTVRGALLCYLLGYYLYAIRGRIKKSYKIAGVAWGGVLTAVFGVLSIKMDRVFIEPFHIWITLYSSAVFLLLIDNQKVKDLSGKRFIKLLASCSLVIYIIHPVFMNALYKVAHIYPDKFPPVIGETLIWFVVSVCAIMGALILKKLPWIKKYI